MDSTPTPPSVLFAAEDSSTSQAIKAYLGNAGYAFDCVTDQDELALALKRKEYDVVLCDAKLRRVGGVELIRAIHSQNLAQAIILLSGARKASEILEQLRAGASDIIRKPVSMSLLEESLQKVVGSVRERGFDYSWYRLVTAETTEFSITSLQLSQMHLPLLLAERLFRAGRIDSHLRLQLDLAFQEAIANCLEHGNLELKSEWKEELDQDGSDRFTQEKRKRLADPDYGNRTIKIKTSLTDNIISIALEDQGKGFLPESQVVEIDSEVLCSGRGLTIIRGVMDKLRFEKGGSLLIMEKRI